MKIILQSLYFMLPAYLANMMPTLFKWIPLGGFPIHERFFGSHKTYRGIFVGVLGGILALWFQTMINPKLHAIELLPYGSFEMREILLYGSAFGAGALIGDLGKSFLKRRLNIAPGRPFIPFDQLDFVIGAFIFISPFSTPPLINIIIILIATPILHLLANIAAYLLHLKNVWW